MTQPTFKGEKLYIGQEYKVKYISGNWVPGVRDYGTYIGELSNVNNLPENKQTEYIFNKVRNEEYAASMPEDVKVEFRELHSDRKTRKIKNWVIESIEPIEPDIVVYKPRQNNGMSNGGKSKKNKRKNISISKYRSIRKY